MLFVAFSSWLLARACRTCWSRPALKLHLLDGASGRVVQELADFLDGEEATLAALGLAPRLSPFHVEVWVADPAEAQAQRAATAAVEQGVAGGRLPAGAWHRGRAQRACLGWQSAGRADQHGVDGPRRCTPTCLQPGTQEEG